MVSASLQHGVRRALRARNGASVLAAGFASATLWAFAAPFPPVFPLASLHPAGGGDGTQGSVLAGIDESDLSGHSASAAGDVNGDGIDDVIVGAWGAAPGGRRQAGESYVVFVLGRPFLRYSPSRACIPPEEATAAEDSCSPASRREISPATR